MVNRAERQPEIAAKLARLRAFMNERGFTALHLATSASTAWLTAGAATYVNQAADGGPSSILVTGEHVFVLTNRVEAPRLEEEEQLAAVGFELMVEPWYRRGAQLARLVEGQRVAQDMPGLGQNVAGEIGLLRARLLPEESERMRAVGRLAAEALHEAIQQVRPGMTEYHIAGRLAAAAQSRGGQLVVNLVAADERIARFRHPLPTARTVERFVLLACCFRREGLIASVSRLVHFGPVPKEVREKARVVAEVDAQLILGTQPGRTLVEQFNTAREAYSKAGYAEAIEEHHQGGLAGYLSREQLAGPENQTVIEQGMAFAWNPSVRGMKSEDTIVLGAAGPEVVTAMEAWPVLRMQVGDGFIERPAVLER